MTNIIYLVSKSYNDYETSFQNFFAFTDLDKAKKKLKRISNEIKKNLKENDVDDLYEVVFSDDLNFEIQDIETGIVKWIVKINVVKLTQ